MKNYLNKLPAIKHISMPDQIESKVFIDTHIILCNISTTFSRN